jgi:hypothetical protein
MYLRVMTFSSCEGVMQATEMTARHGAARSRQRQQACRIHRNDFESIGRG